MKKTIIIIMMLLMVTTVFATYYKMINPRTGEWDYYAVDNMTGISLIADNFILSNGSSCCGRIGIDTDNSLNNTGFIIGVNITWLQAIIEGYNSSWNYTVDTDTTYTYADWQLLNRSKYTDMANFTNSPGYITNDTANFTVDTDTTLTEEEVQDYVGTLIQSGNGIDITYSDIAGTLIPSFDCSDVAGTGLSCSGEDIQHGDTSSQSVITTKGYVDNMTVDTYGHVTDINIYQVGYHEKTLSGDGNISVVVLI